MRNLTSLGDNRELKRRQKQREKEAKNAEKAAVAPAKATAKAEGPKEEDLTPNVSSPLPTRDVHSHPGPP